MFINVLLLAMIFVHQIDSQTTRLPPVNSNCTVTYNEQLYRETEAILIGKKLYKIEDCQIQRAYQACGTPLWFMMQVVCGSVEKQRKKQKNKIRFRRFTQEKLLTDSCCVHLCTIQEMSRYCPW